MFMSDGKAAPCPSKLTTLRISQQKPCIKAEAGALAFHPLTPSPFWNLLWVNW